MSTPHTKTTHKTTEQAIEILGFIRRSNGATLPDITEHFDLPKSTAYTHLNTLQKHGFVVRENGQYWIGLRFREFSVSARTRKPSYQVVRNKTRELTEQTDHEIEFLVEENGRANLVYHSENLSHDSVRLYLHSTAAGKAILAEMSDDRRAAILDRWGLPQETPHTITDRDRLRAELDEIRDRGYAYNDRECFEGYHGIGAVVRDLDQSILGALTIGGPVYRLDEETLHTELADLLNEAVEDIEATLESQRATITTELANT